MMDSDDDFESNSLNTKRRSSQSRNKFRKERDDFQLSSSNPLSTGPHNNQELRRNNLNNPRYINNNANSNPRRHEFDFDNNHHGYQPNLQQHYRSRERFSGQYQPRYDSSRTPPPQPLPGQPYPQFPPSNRYMNQRQPNNYYNDDYPPQGAYKRPFQGPGSLPQFQDTPHKKSKREWSGVDSNGNGHPTGYYEHDNRLGVDYDEYGEEFSDDYTGLNRPVNYPNYSDPGLVQLPPNSNGQGQNGFNSMMMNQMLNITQSMAPIMSQYFNQMKVNPGQVQGQAFQPQMQQSSQGMNEFPTQPRMMTFKEYLRTLGQDDLKSKPESHRLAKYNVYKEEFRAEQTLDFFQKHKNEDWFRLRYHPEESQKRKQEQRDSIKNRLDIFTSLLQKFDIDGKLSLDMTLDDNKKYLLKFLDACMIKLEGGVEEKDLEILEKIYVSQNAQKEETELNLKIPQKTQSIFFKHLPVYVTRQDLERIGGKYEGFKRASISEPAPERAFQRRGWITYDSVCNIKDICSKLNGTRVSETTKFTLNATINRDLDQKIKLISGLSNHVKIVRHDLKLIVKVVQNMDKKWGMYEHEDSNLNNQAKVESRINPLVSKAVEYLTEVNEQDTEVTQIEKDERSSSILDRLILYLRIVHSIDYYNSTEYQQEDFMPYRCGVMHVRGSSLIKSDSNTVQVVAGSQVSSFDPNNVKKSNVNEWIRLFENHIRPYSEYREQIDLDLARKLGLKDHAAEVEKFMKNNCQKVDKDVWLCPLSGKKFKGPDYVRKHIETKHPDKLVELKIEVEYFNKFVLDPKRPYLPEHPMNRNMGKMNQMNSGGLDDFDEYPSNYNMMMMNQSSQQQSGYYYNNGPGLAGAMPTSHMYNQYGSGFYPSPSTNQRNNYNQYNSNNNNGNSLRLPLRR